MSDPTLPFDRVCVTGGSGLLGRFVVRELARDAEVLVLDIAPPETGFAFAEVDVLDIDAVRKALAGQQAVVHLAALDDGVTEIEEDYIKVNVLGTWNVLQAAEELGLQRAIVCSSVAAVGLSATNKPRYLPVDTDHPAAPTGAYGLSKKAIEVLSQGIVARGNLEVICLRPTLVAQADIVYGMACIAAAADGQEPPPPADGKDWRELNEELSPSRGFVSPQDVARAFRAALAAPNISYGVFFVTGPRHVHDPANRRVGDARFRNGTGTAAPRDLRRQSQSQRLRHRDNARCPGMGTPRQLGRLSRPGDRGGMKR